MKLSNWIDFLTHPELSDMLFDLDIDKWEMSRTHWAIKEVNLLKELAAKSIFLTTMGTWREQNSKYNKT